jgi:site-specific DNA recombinase
VEWVRKAVKESHADEIANHSTANTELQKRRETAQRRLDALYDDKVDGKISEEFYQSKMRQYAKEREEAVNALQRLDNANTRYYELGTNVVELAQRARDIYLNKKRTVEDKQLLMRILFENMKLGSTEMVAKYSKAYGLLKEFATEWNIALEHLENSANKGQNSDLTTSCPILLRG